MTDFTFHAAWLDALNELPAKDRPKACEAVIIYGTTGTLTQLKGLAHLVFLFIKQEIDTERAARRRQQEKSQRMRQIVQIRWNKSKNKPADVNTDVNTYERTHVDTHVNTHVNTDVNTHVYTEQPKSSTKYPKMEVENAPHSQPAGPTAEPTSQKPRARKEEDNYISTGGLITSGKKEKEKDNFLRNYTQKEKKERGSQSTNSLPSPTLQARAREKPAPPAATEPEVNPLEFVHYFNAQLDAAGSLIPRARPIINDRRRTAILARAREYGRQALAEMAQHAARSPMLNGHNDRSWCASLDWCLRPTNFPKIIEGNYDYNPLTDNHNATNRQDTPTSNEQRDAAVYALMQQLEREGLAH